MPAIHSSPHIYTYTHTCVCTIFHYPYQQSNEVGFVTILPSHMGKQAYKGSSTLPKIAHKCLFLSIQNSQPPSIHHKYSLPAGISASLFIKRKLQVLNWKEYKKQKETEVTTPRQRLLQLGSNDFHWLHFHFPTALSKAQDLFSHCLLMVKIPHRKSTNKLISIRKYTDAKWKNPCSHSVKLLK